MPFYGCQNSLRHYSSTIQKEDARMSSIDLKKIEKVGVITLNDGENRLHPDFVSAILAAFDDIEKDRDISSVK